MRELMAPVFVQVALTFLLLIGTGATRVSALRRREVRIKDIALGQRAWPQRATQFSNAFQNQFELPVIFYALIAFVLITGQGGWPMVPLAWGFVATRILHAAIHTTGNVVTYRFYAYMLGMAILLAMWGLLAYRVLSTVTA